mmetsp:Transcript_579/g.879  ORF Transcript_579/g.879 Transcript_579/m.879 type:complete len:274 (-) Transcript_579:165-986(-)
MDSAHEEYSMPLSDVISTAEPSFGSIRLAGEGEGTDISDERAVAMPLNSSQQPPSSLNKNIGDSKYSIPQTLSDLSQINIDDGSIPLKSTNRSSVTDFHILFYPVTQIFMHYFLHSHTHTQREKERGGGRSFYINGSFRPERKEMLQPNTQIRCRVSEKKIANDGKPLVTLDFSQQPENAPRMFIKRRTPVVESRNSSEKLIAYVDIEISSNRIGQIALRNGDNIYELVSRFLDVHKLEKRRNLALLASAIKSNVDMYVTRLRARLLNKRVQK